MENNDQTRKFNELGRWLSVHDEELDKLKKELVDSKDENLGIIVRYVDKQLGVLVDNLSLSLVMFFAAQTNPNFVQDLTNEMNEIGALARKEGMSLMDYRLKLKKDGTLPKHIKEIEDNIDLMKKTIWR